MAILLIEGRSCEKEFAMGHGIKLNAEQWEELDNLRLRTPSADVFRNCLIILMSDCRETVSAIAGRLGCGTDTVIRVRRLYRNGGVNALYPIKPPGRPCRATTEFLKHMSQAVQSNPMMLGYGFSTWSATRLVLLRHWLCCLVQERQLPVGHALLLRVSGVSLSVLSPTA